MKKPKIRLFPRQKGKLWELLDERTIGLNSPPESAGWPTEKEQIEAKLQSTLVTDIESVIAALENKTLGFYSLRRQRLETPPRIVIFERY